MSTTGSQSRSNRGIRSGEVHLIHRPLRDGGLSTWSALLCAVAVAAGVGFISQSATAGALSLAALALTMWRMWIPVEFVIGPRGVTEIIFGRRRQIAWRHVARYELKKSGALLYADAERTPLALLRSTYVHWGSQRDELLVILARYLDREEIQSDSAVQQKSDPSNPI